MDRWERRLHLLARAASPSASAPTAPREPGDPIAPVIDARDRALRLDAVTAEQIHPDEGPVVQMLLEIAEQRPGMRAELPLLARAGDRWEQRWFEVVHEVMGPVARPIDLVARWAQEHDLDGVPEIVDRSRVLAHLARTLERSGEHMVAVLLVDLDRFKLHNDLLGADGANELLGVMTERVQTTAGRSFSAALGGDEFVVVLEHVDDPLRAKALAEQLRRAIAEPVTIGDESMSVTASVGVATGGRDTSADHLLRDADTALFAGKDNGRDRVQVFGRKLEARVARQLGTAQRLRHALAEGTLELHYQPVVSLDTGEVVAAEALMRVAGDSEEQPLSPASLIDAAEDSGLIARLGRYVLEETASEVARWERRLDRDRSFRVSVNISPVQLANRDFSNAIGHALSAARVSPQRLSLELTESVLLGASPTVDLVVQDLVELGIAFGLDDFGADGSSLGGLRRFPIEFLKIDRALVRSIDHDRRVETIVASTVSMAHQLGVATVAVGVERESQRDLLCRLGCDAAQGYLFSPPLVPGDLADLL